MDVDFLLSTISRDLNKISEEMVKLNRNAELIEINLRDLFMLFKNHVFKEPKKED